MSLIKALIACAVACVATYFVCGIPFGYLLARIRGVDVRQVGSGNIGTTNVARSVGVRAAGLTLLLDLLKGFLSVCLSKIVFAYLLFGGDFSQLAPEAEFGWMLAWVYLATIVGHIYSCYLAFHGGKGIAVGLGGALAFIAPAALGALSIFLFLAVITQYVSVGSLAAACTITILSYLIYRPSWPFMLAMLLVSVFVCWAHRANVIKLLHGEESHFSFRKK